MELPQDVVDDLKRSKHHELYRHEAGFDVIDAYDIVTAENGEIDTIVVSVTGKDLELCFMALTGSRAVPMRTYPALKNQRIFH